MPMKVCADCSCTPEHADPVCDYAEGTARGGPHNFVEAETLPQGTIRSFVDGTGDNYGSIAGHTGAAIRVFVRERATGLVAEEPRSVFTGPMDRGRYFWWSQGNGACDANRMRAFGRREEGEHHCHHGDATYDIEIRRADDGRVIYTEWEPRS
jgi:hypothetical protein